MNRKIILFCLFILFVSSCVTKKIDKFEGLRIDSESIHINSSELEDAYKSIKLWKDSLEKCLKPPAEESLETESLNLLKTGTYHALIIGVQDYESDDCKDLAFPINDAEELRECLVSLYSFEAEDVNVLRNPTGEEIEIALNNLNEKLEENDDVLIFYAGHGYWDDRMSQGYWLPADAKRNAKYTWISNSIIQDYLRGMSAYARNVLLITDACFGGSIFATRSAFTKAELLGIEKLYYTPSCQAMTSGTKDQEVDDKSVFLQYLVENLRNNNQLHLSAEKLFSSFKQAVIGQSKSSQIPQFGVVREAGDEGGDFIFIKR
tara:strand:+ start:831 stop:1787 length:957 start_codon:yes stop_codon:yes gene_type:complete